MRLACRYHFSCFFGLWLAGFASLGFLWAFLVEFASPRFLGAWFSKVSQPAPDPQHLASSPATRATRHPAWRSASATAVGIRHRPKKGIYSSRLQQVPNPIYNILLPFFYPVTSANGSINDKHQKQPGTMGQTCWR